MTPLSPSEPPRSFDSERTTLVDVVFGVVVALAIAARFSCSLDDHDSCLFVAGVERFNIAEHRPHPPGYPVYILAAKALAALGGSAFVALASLSVAASGIAAMLLPQLFRRLGAGGTLAYVQSVLVVVTPCFWLSGSKVLTDMPGFALTLLLWIAHLRQPGARGAFWLGVCTGLACGVRAHVFLPLLPFLLQGPVRPRLVGTALGFAAWYGGMALHQGLDSVMLATERQAMMRFQEKNVSAFVGDGLWRRGVRFAKGFAEGAMGLEPWRVTIFVIGASVAAGVWSFGRRLFETAGALRTAFASPRGRIFAAAAVQCVFVFLFLPAHPRYFLCVLPAVAMLLSFDRVVVAGAFAVCIATFTAERARILHTVPPAPFQAVDYMDRVDPDGRVPLLASKMFAYAREGSPERVRSRMSWDPTVLPPPGAFFTDRDAIPDEFPGHRLAAEAVFERDEAVHDKDWRVRLRYFEPATETVAESRPAR